MPIAHEVEAELDLGNAKLIPSTIAKVFLRGGLFLDKGDILLQQSNCWWTPGIDSGKKCCRFRFRGIVIDLTDPVTSWTLQSAQAQRPLQPILSFVSSPTYRLSRFLADLLPPVVDQTGSYVKTSRTFVEFVKSLSPAREETMIFCDVVSLFTCVPTDLAIPVAHCRLENNASFPEHTNLSVDDIVDLLAL